MGNTVQSTAERRAERALKGKQFFSKIVSLLGLVLLVAFFAIVTQGKLLQLSNLELIVKQGFTLFITALSAVFIMATGNLDFSIGANIGFCCTMCALTARAFSPTVGILITVGIGTTVGLINGLVITKLKLPSFITCLCMMFILTAATQTICAAHGGSISMPLAMRKWESLQLYAIVGVIYFVITALLFCFTRFGKYMKAIGVSPEAARQSGINLDRMIVLGYILTGFAAGLAAFFSMIRTGGASTTTGTSMSTDVMIAIVFGGMSISGGATSKISAAFLGFLIVTVLNNGMILAGFGGELQQLVKGILFLVVIAVSTKRDANTIIK